MALRHHAVLDPGAHLGGARQVRDRQVAGVPELILGAEQLGDAGLVVLGRPVAAVLVAPERLEGLAPGIVDRTLCADECGVRPVGDEVAGVDELALGRSPDDHELGERDRFLVDRRIQRLLETRPALDWCVDPLHAAFYQLSGLSISLERRHAGKIAVQGFRPRHRPFLKFASRLLVHRGDPHERASILLRLSDVLEHERDQPRRGIYLFARPLDAGDHRRET